MNRGEANGDTAGSTATLTVELAPHPNLVFRLDNRVDVASNERFIINNDGDPANVVFSSVLGMAAHSD